MISGEDGLYWDVMYDKNRYRKEPIIGFFFRPDGQYYAYHYYGEGRTPFDLELSDASNPPNVEANLKRWSVLSDTSIQIGSNKYIIEYINKDTISLKTGTTLSRIFRLIRSKR